MVIPVELPESRFISCRREAVSGGRQQGFPIFRDEWEEFWGEKSRRSGFESFLKQQGRRSDPGVQEALIPIHQPQKEYSKAQDDCCYDTEVFLGESHVILTKPFFFM